MRVLKNKTKRIEFANSSDSSLTPQSTATGGRIGKQGGSICNSCFLITLVFFCHFSPAVFCPRLVHCASGCFFSLPLPLTLINTLSGEDLDTTQASKTLFLVVIIRTNISHFNLNQTARGAGVKFENTFIPQCGTL